MVERPVGKGEAVGGRERLERIRDDVACLVAELSGGVPEPRHVERRRPAHGLDQNGHQPKRERGSSSNHPKVHFHYGVY